YLQVYVYVTLCHGSLQVSPYFKSICIKERWNPQKHRQDMPVRYWKYLTEKQ
ncbi:DUF4130 domain-containing protein, partial [Phocaeicola dorei]|uniref:DUF4130 domain-containing protein n=1 Tax=Phocaeicola dorei TaxID=357276 RepID=UPI001C38EFC1